MTARSGMTLAELLVALLLTGLALAITAEAVRRTLEFQTQLQSVRIAREDAGAALNAVRSRLERLLPLTWPGSAGGAAGGGEEETLFEGSAEHVAFIAADPGYPARAGLYEYRIAVEAAGENRRLVLYRRALNDPAAFGRDDGEAFESWLLIETGAEAVFEFARAEGGWSAGWSGEPGYPALVRLSFTGEAAPADMIARLPASVDGTQQDDEPAGGAGARQEEGLP